MGKRKADSSGALDSQKTKKSKMASNDNGLLVRKGKNEKFTFFYSGHCPFSQHYMVNFVIDGVEYNCAEQYMMHQKAVLFEDKEMEVAIMKSHDPRQQKQFGRRVGNFDASVWDSKCQDVVKTANIAKFEQNKDLKDLLLGTEGSTLVEAAPRDRIWGIGMSGKNPDAVNRQKWRGRNLLGLILTDVRNVIASGTQNKNEQAIS